MKVSLRDVLILLDCAKLVLRIESFNQTGWDRKVILDAYERVINEMNSVTLEIKTE